MRIAQCVIGVMAATWPKTTAWPSDLREHATHLSKYLREALLCIETAKEQPIPIPLVKTMIAAMSVMLTKIENAPDYNTIMQALTTIQNDVKTTAETGKTAAIILQETNNIAKAIHSAPYLKSSYASVLSSNLAPISRPITISTQTPSLIQA